MRHVATRDTPGCVLVPSKPLQTSPAGSMRRFTHARAAARTRKYHIITGHGFYVRVEADKCVLADSAGGLSPDQPTWSCCLVPSCGAPPVPGLVQQPGAKLKALGLWDAADERAGGSHTPVTPSPRRQFLAAPVATCTPEPKPRAALRLTTRPTDKRIVYHGARSKHGRVHAGQAPGQRHDAQVAPVPVVGGLRRRPAQ